MYVTPYTYHNNHGDPCLMSRCSFCVIRTWTVDLQCCVKPTAGRRQKLSTLTPDPIKQSHNHVSLHHSFHRGAASGNSWKMKGLLHKYPVYQSITETTRNLSGYFLTQRMCSLCRPLLAAERTDTRLHNCRKLLLHCSMWAETLELESLVTTPQVRTHGTVSLPLTSDEIHGFRVRPEAQHTWM